YRTPNFDELYTRNIFDGHYFIGNENLTPEKSWSFEVSVKKTSYINQSKFSNQIMLSANNIKDLITNAHVRDLGATPVYENINISKYNSLNISTTNFYTINNFDLCLGGSFIWISQLIDTGNNKTPNDLLFTYNLNASVSYFIPFLNTNVAAYYKYTSVMPTWVMSNDGYVISNQDAYHFLDASARKKFFKESLEVS